MFNDFENRHKDYRQKLQDIFDQLKVGNNNIQSELLDLEWSIKNDLYRLEIIGNDAFEDEIEELVKFVPVIDVIKQKYSFNYQIEESSFDDFEEDEEEDYIDDSLEDEEDIEEAPEEYEGQMIEGEIDDLFPEIDDHDKLD